jgi:predicted AlkP superfamily phosphohydrolase/phosphomutase
MSRAGPVLVLGLDMADGGLIRRWSRQGRLPHFADLIAGGTLLELDSTAEILHTSAWPTFATGVLPGRHGVYYPYQPTPGQQFARQIDADQYGERTFWSRANSQKRSCVVYDIPETFPEPDFGGCGIFDWGTWAQYGRTSGQPSSLLRELRARFGKYPLGYEAMRLGFDRPEGIDERLLRAVRYKSDTVRWLLQRADWDLAVVGFGETHCAGHYLWPERVRTPNDGPEHLFQRLFAVYAALDEALGSLRANVPGNVTVLVVSGDGVRANQGGWHLLPAMLERLGYASGTGGSSTDAPARRSSLIGRVKQLVPPGLKQQIEAHLPLRFRNQLGLQAQAARVNWSQTRAFALPTDLEGCVRINLKGREPQGTVEPGAQYDDLCQELRTHLEELVNPATGAPAVRRVWIRNEIFPGPRQEELPDLIVTWQEDAPIAALASPRGGAVEGANPDIRPGTHSRSGFLMAQGSDIPRGYLGRGRLVDVAPTVLRLLGLSPAADLDGTTWQLPASESGPARQDAG